jgi:hypothetical protein
MAITRPRPLAPLIASHVIIGALLSPVRISEVHNVVEEVLKSGRPLVVSLPWDEDARVEPVMITLSMMDIAGSSSG